MLNILNNSTAVILILCSVVILSYYFSYISLRTRIPSVILLLLTGIVTKSIVSYLGVDFKIPASIIEIFGTIGLIMIILEAGLDLQINKKNIPLIRKSLFSALFILLLSVFFVALILRYWLQEPMLNSIVYALPLSIISGAIVIPSLKHLNNRDREFLVYESSFSDIIGILLFNYIVTSHTFSFLNLGFFVLNLIVALAISLLITIYILFLFTRSKVKVKFFLAFSILIALYISGKMINMPSLIIILVFGLLISNWEKIKYKKLHEYLPLPQIDSTRELLFSITAESSFLIRTFFFILFGYSIDIKLFTNIEVILIGSAIVISMLIARYFYLRTFLKANIFPALFFMPRGLITILLFYKIPTGLQLSSFNEGILFYVVLLTSLIMMFGAVFYKPDNGIESLDEIYKQG